jgi:bifunctional non-homologous end joining protein LigD
MILYGGRSITGVTRPLAGQTDHMGDVVQAPIEPMLATPGGLPADLDRWGLEIKWDGVRVLAHLDGKGSVRATGRRATDVADRYPELSGLADLLPGQAAVLDGEVVAFDRYGRPSFERLQQRMHVSGPPQRLIREVPVHYIVFDLLELDGHPLYPLPYRDRRLILDDLDLAGGPIEVPPYLRADDSDQVRELVDYTFEQQLEGLLAKRLDSPYLPGRRVDFWRKVKNVRTQEVVIGGWKPGKGRREGGIGSLLVGVYTPEGLFCFCGHVGTGFTDRALDDLFGRLTPLARSSSPYDEEVPREYSRDAHWVEPVLVGEVGFSAWTGEGRLRFPSWRGIREDKDPREVVREP